ncbi:hemerythrin domain-containing protein [Maribacter sp. ANRC-HE7]|uniref:Hemerythrin domain-containing protein n=1 Tax=Maribacter aquimaris TaxID=2737171 RepID=A0ABR7V0S4_9FLAO|nr:hemerythrin domain-containing protein [Maribacter aquimaris]MBD0778403.1 hemerythrin domain-containing protein [Maribacter aquimaris]
MKTSPIKRSKALMPVSRDHHYGLLLCYKLRTGFSKNIAPERMKRYTDWFFKTHLIPHFEVEEKYIFPILGNQHELVKRAISEHCAMVGLFENTHDIELSLHQIEETLKQHIRFEERELFNAIEKVATQAQLALVAEFHKDEDFIDNQDDPFWE